MVELLPGTRQNSACTWPAASPGPALSQKNGVDSDLWLSCQPLLGGILQLYNLYILTHIASLHVDISSITHPSSLVSKGASIKLRLQRMVADRCMNKNVFLKLQSICSKHLE